MCQWETTIQCKVEGTMHEKVCQEHTFFYSTYTAALRVQVQEQLDFACACFLIYVCGCTTFVFDYAPMGDPASWRKCCLKQAKSKGSKVKEMDIDLEP